MRSVIQNSIPVAAVSRGSGMLIGAISLIGIVMVFVYFGLPVMRSMNPVQINLPSTRVVVPEKNSVLVNQEK